MDALLRRLGRLAKANLLRDRARPENKTASGESMRETSDREHPGPTRESESDDPATSVKSISRSTGANGNDEKSRRARGPRETWNGGSEPRSAQKNGIAREKPPATSPAGQLHQQQAPGSFYEYLTPATRSRLNTLAQIGEDWLYLALLGIIMAILSLSMDSVITMFLETRIWLSRETSEQNLILQYLAWCTVPILLVTFSTGFVHLCSPTAIGSGIPEMKTILRGVVLNEYLTFRTLVAKIVGLTFTLGSGLPLGKEGPSVHMASIVATLLSKLVASFQGIYENESRTSEMLSAACAVGVAATFYAPIGGVLFSIEVTTVYFAVRNYWRGFFAACCGATIWRLLSFYIKNDESISAIFKTNFSTDYPFDPIELLVFAFIGATCGLAGASYIKFHREIVQFFRRHKRISDFLQQNRFVYPTLVTLIITSSTFPPLLGQYTAATLSTHTTIEHMFSNRTWGLGSQDLVSSTILDSWTTESTNFYLHLVLYILMLFWTSALASTIPTPSGVFIPVVKMGAAYGRLVGELMAAAYPLGFKYSRPAAILPGSYAVVGAAAFSGAVTHTVSTSVILFEMTGQIVHIIPVILGVLISNAVCQSLQPSIYDSIIEIKKLPYLPPIASSNSISHKILVKDFMNSKNIPFVWKERCTYAELKLLLSTHRKIISFPLVESPASMKLLGSVGRPDLLKLLYLHLGRERRLQEVCRRNSDTLTPAIHLLKTISGRLASSSPVDEDPATDSADKQRALADQMIDQFKLELAQGSKQVVASAKSAEEKRPSIDSSDSRQSTEDQGLQFKRRPSSVLKRSHSERRNSTFAQQDNSEPQLQDGPPTGGDVLDCDHTRLIIAASKCCSNKYGATTSTSGTLVHLADAAAEKNSSKLTAPGVEEPKVDSLACRCGEELLLNDCQKRDDAYQAAVKEFGGVARIVNQYDRGSSMDEDALDSANQRLENHLASMSLTPPEIVVVVAPPPPVVAPAVREPDGARGKLASRGSSPGRQLGAKTGRRTLAPPDAGQAEPAKSAARQRQTPFATSGRLASSSSFNHPSPNNMAPSPSLSLRPTKSILKTSSFSSSSLSKRMTIASSQSFANTVSHYSQNQYQGGANFSLEGYNAAAANNYGGGGGGGGKATSHLGGIKFTLDGNNEAANGAHPEDGGVRQRRKVRLPRLRVVDMTPEEQEQWEKEQLNAFIDMSRCQVDEAPFQLVEQTSLYRVHTLFSMLGLNHAYVTSFGRLVGIVTLKDIRYAIEKMLQEKV